MADIASKNLYELLGNTHDEDSDREPDPPVKVVDKTPARNTKRNATGDAPASRAPAGTDGRGPRRGGFSGNEGAFRDRNAGSANNRTKPTDEAAGDRKPRGEGGRRGAGRQNFDRHSRNVVGDSEKQVGHGWGANEGGAELKDEQAGEAIAQAEQKDAQAGDGEGVAEPAEPEDTSVSYADYLAQLAEKKLALGAGIPEARKPNEGTKQNKKWANAKELSKDEEEDFVAAAAGKAKRERERKAKQTIDIDNRYIETPEQRGGRGGGGFRGGRGGRGDGPSRDRGEGGFRRGGRGDGDRGGRGGRGDSRGPRPQQQRSHNAINPEDTSAFPSLGA